jgi:hypothetical protein
MAFLLMTCPNFFSIPAFVFHSIFVATLHLSVLQKGALKGPNR